MVLLDGRWYYADTGLLAPNWHSGGIERPCGACGLIADYHGPDPCLGWLPGVSGACCGHGVQAGYVVRSGNIWTGNLSKLNVERLGDYVADLGELS